MDIEEIIAKKTEQFWNSRFAEGMTQGITQGLAQGERNNKIATARNLLAMKILSNEQIAQATNLSVAEISAL